MCVTVVQWSRSCLHLQINRVRLPATLFSVSLYRLFFFRVWSLFLTLFFLLAFYLYSYCWPCWSCTWINKYFKSGVLFSKRDFKSSWSAYWPSLRLDKNHKLSRHVSPLKQLYFFNVSWHYDKQHTVHHKLYYNLHPTPTSDTLAKGKLAFCTSS